MSGIPQELVQRLAQEFLRQVRLEAAADPTLAITLESEDAAVAQAEVANQPSPEKDQQAGELEELPGPVPLLLRHPAHPTTPIDEATGPATNSARPPPSSEQAGPSTSSAQPPLAPPLVAGRPSAADVWLEIREELRNSCVEFLRARARMQTASEALDGFLLEYLQKGVELAGEYPQRVTDERAAQAASRAEHDRRSNLRASDRAVELARAQLAGLQRTTASRNAALQRKLEEAEENSWHARRSAPTEVGERAPLRKRCPVCGLEGTTGRDRECPNRRGHKAILARKAEEAHPR